MIGYHSGEAVTRESGSVLALKARDKTRTIWCFSARIETRLQRYALLGG